MLLEDGFGHSQSVIADVTSTLVINIRWTVRPRFSGTVPEIRLMSRANFVLDVCPRFFKKIIQIEIYIEYEIYTD
jgi:hypothetical protein